MKATHARSHARAAAATVSRIRLRQLQTAAVRPDRDSFARPVRANASVTRTRTVRIRQAITTSAVLMEPHRWAAIAATVPQESAACGSQRPKLAKKKIRSASQPPARSSASSVVNGKTNAVECLTAEAASASRTRFAPMSAPAAAPRSTAPTSGADSGYRTAAAVTSTVTARLLR